MDTIIGIVITARVHQGRWPEKIMADIGGKPMIEQVIIRTKKLHNLDHICLATSELPEDDYLAGLATEYNLDLYRGETENVVLRIKKAADELHLTHIIQFPANYPLFHIGYTNQMIIGMKDNPRYWMYRLTDWGVHFGIGIMPIGLRKEAVDLYAKYGWGYFKNKKRKKAFTYTVTTTKEILDKYHVSIAVIYPFHVAIINKIIDHLGFYPEQYTDIIRAYTEIKKWD